MKICLADENFVDMKIFLKPLFSRKNVLMNASITKKNVILRF